MISRFKTFVKRVLCRHDYCCRNPKSSGIFYLMECKHCGHTYLLLNED